MKLSARQIKILSRYFADLSKILVASTVIGYFIPTGVGPITSPVFAGGTGVALIFIILGIRLVK